jgi:C1A family cysteine protease
MFRIISGLIALVCGIGIVVAEPTPLWPQKDPQVKIAPVLDRQRMPLGNGPLLAQAKVDVKAPAKNKHGRGHKLPTKEESRKRHLASNAKYTKLLRSLPKATQAAYDARNLGIVPPVGNQDGCGNCYMWSGTKVCSAAQAVAGIFTPTANSYTTMLSVQATLDCHPELGGCNGGDEYAVAQQIQSGGVPTTSAYPGGGYAPGNCQPTTGMTLYYVTNLVYCDPSQTDQGVASTQSIKNCILSYGYVSVAGAAGSWDNVGPNDTITGNDNQIDHAIGLVGWDDNHNNGDGSTGAWIMQNQWDTDWGGSCGSTWAGGGYAWIKYGADSIGTEAFIALVSSPVPPTPPTPTPPVPPTPPTPVPPAPVTSLGTFSYTDPLGNVSSWTTNGAFTFTPAAAPTPTPVSGHYEVRGLVIKRLVWVRD